jgi:hypothetical protein
VRPRKDKRDVDLISDALPFGGLSYGESDAISDAVGSVKFYSRPALLDEQQLTKLAVTDKLRLI